MLDAWVNGLRKGEPSLSYESQQRTALATSMAVESMTVDAVLAVDTAVLSSHVAG